MVSLGSLFHDEKLRCFELKPPILAQKERLSYGPQFLSISGEKTTALKPPGSLEQLLS